MTGGMLFLMTKKINYYPVADPKNETPHFPIPSVKVIPDWYKKIGTYQNGDSSVRIFPNSNDVNSTAKWCNPFLDGLTMGYMITLQDDVLVSKIDGYVNFKWRTDRIAVSGHALDQFSTKGIPPEYALEIFKFHNNVTFETPEGYSTLFTHPLNRFDLPFLTFSGVVDTDTYKLSTNFPFIIKNTFEGVLEAGTPIAQAIPFKRESWQGVENPYDSVKVQFQHDSYYKKIVRPYKNLIWHKKSYQ